MIRLLIKDKIVIKTNIIHIPTKLGRQIGTSWRYHFRLIFFWCQMGIWLPFSTFWPTFFEYPYSKISYPRFPIFKSLTAFSLYIWMPYPRIIPLKISNIQIPWVFLKFFNTLNISDTVSLGFAQNFQYREYFRIPYPWGFPQIFKYPVYFRIPYPQILCLNFQYSICSNTVSQNSP